MRIIAVLILTALAVTGCGKGSSAMTFEATEQHRVQDTVLRHLRDTAAALPAGTVIDGSRFAGSGHVSLCDDTDSGPAAPMRFHTIGEVKSQGGQDAVVSGAGELWRRWGWQVVEREGFATPNRFGYSPDGYRLQIVAAGEDHPPVLQASSPCFPRPSVRDEVPFPTIITGA